ncbi:metallophosphoesterase [Blautia sp. MSK.20.9]|uniref:metallophosphoesterase n=1 Tax=Dorea TaxID=189330 RepID=UPI001FB901AA|nr:MULTISPECIES: metallophosphoesterase [Dorea]MCM1893434.1 metallophosphoesterase [Dorea sp. MB18-49]NSK09555.1 metallophosphoesterase [Blautia sp. MSK.20.9]
MIKIILIIVAVFIVYCLIEMIRELRDFRVTKYRICSQKLNGIKREKKIIFLSDLHNRMYGEENERLLESIRNQHPDLILIGGDMLVRKDGNSYDKTVHFLAKLPGICPVYCANGNHEQKLKELPDKYEQSYEEYKKALTASGIHMLENASETVKLDEVPVKLSGLEIPLGAYARFGKKELSLKEITDRIGEHGDDYQILLAHHPGYMKEYLAYGADLILGGHYHGCVVQLPGIGGVISTNFTLFPKYSGGIYPEGEQTAVVSRGLGTHSVPLRLWNWPELIVLELSGNER